SYELPVLHTHLAFGGIGETGRGRGNRRGCAGTCLQTGRHSEGTYSCQQRAVDGVVGPSRRSEQALRHDDRIGEFPSMYHRAATRGTTHDIEPSARDPSTLIPARGRPGPER